MGAVLPIDLDQNQLALDSISNTNSLRFAATRNPITIACPALYFGATCAEKQNVSMSVISGIVSLILACLGIFILLYTEWPRRISDFVHRHLIDRMIDLCQYIVQKSKEEVAKI